jgi:hypothetical protein
MEYPPFPRAQNSNITSGAQRKIFEEGTIFFGHPVQCKEEVQRRREWGKVQKTRPEQQIIQQPIE